MNNSAFLFGLVSIDEVPVELVPFLDRAAQVKEVVEMTATFFLALGGDKAADAKIASECKGRVSVWREWKSKALKAMKEKGQRRGSARKVGQWLAANPEKAAIMMLVCELVSLLKKELAKLDDENIRPTFNTIGLPQDILDVTSTAYGVGSFVFALSQTADTLEKLDADAAKWLLAFEIDLASVTRKAIARLRVEVSRLRTLLETTNASLSIVARDVPVIDTMRANSVHELMFKVGRYALDRIALGKSSGVRAFSSESSLEGGSLQAGKPLLHEDRLLLAALKRFPKFSVDEIENLLAGEALRLSHSREPRTDKRAATPGQGPWSTPDSPSRWAKRFKCSVDTFQRWADEGTIRVRKLSDRSYQLHVDDVPVHVDELARAGIGGQ